MYYGNHKVGKDSRVWAIRVGCKGGVVSLDDGFHETHYDTDEVGRMDNVQLLDVLLVPERVREAVG